jgi:SAM-dependent methyltransferase
MIFKRINAGIKVDDNDFDAMYTSQLKEISKIHFTPVDVAKTAARFLVNKPGAKVLDIGSGAGKFCMIGAACTNGFFTGVEQRQHLYQLSGFLSRCYNLTNVQFMHGNFMEIEFRQFDAVYFFNAFYENIFPTNSMDSTVPLDKALYTLYSEYMREQLQEMPVGTRLATYFSFMDEVPPCYKIQSTEFDRKLKLWEKVS